MISIIVGYRNRDLDRVKRSIESIASQSYTNYELIFVDYGSDIEISKSVKALIEFYHFAKYIYVDTRGMFWNRAHALNIGAQLSTSKNLLFSDIDLIFPIDFFEKINDFDTDSNFYTFQCYYTNEKHTNYSITSDLISTSRINYIGLCYVSKQSWSLAGGYSDYFMFWGGEDDNFYDRLIKHGFLQVTEKVDRFPILHQWHLNDKMSFPTPWYLEMVYHLYSKDSLSQSEDHKSYYRNIKLNDRELIPPFSDIDFIKIELYPNKLFQFNIFLKIFFELSPGSYGKFTFKYDDQIKISKKDKVISIINKLLIIFNSNYRFNRIKKNEKTHTIELWNNFTMYFIGKSRTSIQDYYIQTDANESTLYFKKC